MREQKSSKYTNITVRSDVANNLQFMNYISRMIQNQTFGWHLLLTSTCLVKNAFLINEILIILTKCK
jgi:hypothetical protein